MIIEKKLQALKWKWTNFVGSVSFVCGVIIVISIVLFILSVLFFDTNSTLYEASFAMLTGVVASALVTLIINWKQKKEQFEKKRAMLFDAGFLIVSCTNEYQEFCNNQPKEFCSKIKQLHAICIKPANYIFGLYESNAALFDVIEIQFIRKIRSNYYFLNKLLNCDDISDSDIEKYFSDGLGEGSKGMQTYWKLLNDIKENLIELKIKWELDGILPN